MQRTVKRGYNVVLTQASSRGLSFLLTLIQVNQLSVLLIISLHSFFTFAIVLNIIAIVVCFIASFALGLFTLQVDFFYIVVVYIYFFADASSFSKWYQTV